MPLSKADIIAKLQRDLLPLQGYKSSLSRQGSIELGPINDAFPNGIFPTGSIHEFIISKTEQTAPTWGFVTGIAGKLVQGAGVTLWISSRRSVFPPGLAIFGIQPEKIIFIDLQNELDCFWVMEEALKCKGLTVVVCETQNLSFTASRRFQLAVEQSGITGFVLRHMPRSLSANACIARWRISSLKSQLQDEMPGVGFPRWNVELLKLRNGKQRNWQVEFAAGQFKHITGQQAILTDEKQISGIDRLVSVQKMPGISDVSAEHKEILIAGQVIAITTATPVFPGEKQKAG
jgi:protein ImuA